MPIAVNDKTKDSEHMFKALKAHILRERQRKKQEREAEVEEERLRKEREARAQQDVMSLGETREQITQLEHKLSQLKEEKHQLFLQLKKVLNEDDRRRQLVKENNEMITIQSLQPGGLVHSQLFLPQNIPRNTPLGTQQGLKPITAGKRNRSPSPPPPVQVYHQGYASAAAYKPQPAPSYAQSAQKDDNRRGNDIVRAVLWNKQPQYASQPGTYYTGPQQDFVYYPAISREQQQQPGLPPRSVYEGANNRAPAGYHLTPGPALASAKPGGITTGYPVRAVSQYQQTQPPPASLYTAGNQRHYQPAPPPGSQPSLAYPPRE